MARRAVPLLLGLILLLGALLRFTGVNWDENQHLHPDERFITMVETAISLPRSFGEYFDTASSPLNPYNRNFGSFVYGTFPLFLVKFAGDFLVKTGYDQVHLVGRYFSGLFDLGTVLAIFFLGRRMYGTAAGLLAALFLATSVLDIQQSHFFTVDTFANLPLVLAFWFALDIAEGRGGWRSFALTGLFFGLAVATRLNLALFAGIIGLAGVLRLLTAVREKGLPRVSWTSAGVAADMGPTRSFALASTALADSQAENASPIAESANLSPRIWSLGPLTIELETIRKGHSYPDAITPQEPSTTMPWSRLLVLTVGGLLLSALIALLVFRVAQPYAFKGIFGINPKWTQDLNSLTDLLSGKADYPPSHQWTDRLAYIFPWTNIVLWGLGLPLGLVAWLGFGVAGWELVRKRKWIHLLPFIWVAVVFLYQGGQFVKTMRYSLPLYPFLALFSGFFLMWLWRRAVEWRTAGVGPNLSSRRKLALVVAGAAGVVTVAYTLFWAFAFTSIYTRPVTRVAASRWIYANVPPGSNIANERWDDPIPLRVDGKDGFFNMYHGIDMEPYNEDGPEKKTQLLQWLDQADYIFLTSNRLYGSIPRLPLRYPLTTRYYQWLFDGQLGFKLVKTFTSYPQLAGIEINDDSAEEAFSVYDHPKVLIYQKTSGYSHQHTLDLFNTVDLSNIIRQTPLHATEARDGLLLKPSDLTADRQGGTWTDIYHPGDLLNTFPVIAWVTVLELLGGLAFPIVFVALRGLFDRGFALSKTLGVLFLAWGAWTLGSYHLLPFSQAALLMVACAIGVVSTVLARANWASLVEFVRARWKLLLIEEALWLAFFAIFLLIRMGNPDLWHPWYGGEKPMDFAYLNAVTKSTYFPPYDPWFSGGYINYYYFGQMISAALLRLTGIVPEVGYNLLLPMFFAMTALGAFTVAFNLLAPPAVSTDLAAKTPERPRFNVDRALLAGILASILVVLVGNLGEVQLLVSNIDKLRSQGLGALPIGWYYWNATRTIAETINEFPFFTFLYADLHAHLMGLAFALGAMALALHAILLRARLGVFDLVILALTLGSLRAINTWDYPTYLAVIGAALVIGYFATRSTPGEQPGIGNWLERLLVLLVTLLAQVGLIVIPGSIAGIQVSTDALTYVLVIGFAVVLALAIRSGPLDPFPLVSAIGWRLIGIMALATALYWPFISNYGTAYTSVEPWSGPRTTLPDYLIVYGLLFFLLGSFLVLELLRTGRRRGAWRLPSLLLRRPSRLGHSLLLMRGLSRTAMSGIELPLYVLFGLFLLEAVLLFLNQPIIAAALPFALASIVLLLRRESTERIRFVSLLILAGSLMTVMVEFVTLKGDIGRMNTVFKFYLQVWVFFAVASAAGLAFVGASLVGRRLPLLRLAWWSAFALLLLGGLSYTGLAAWAKIHDRYPIGNTAELRPSIDGMDYLKIAQYQDQNRDLNLVYDYDAIQWLRRNVIGSPVVAEASAPLYHWGSRVSIYTGLPTIIGWDWHQKQQRSLIPGEVIDRRLEDVRNLFSTADARQAAEILLRYDVSLIYVGEEEKAFYPAAGLAKFDTMTQAGLLQIIYDSGAVRIYRVIKGA